MKTRIKVVSTAGGDSRYYPQYKVRFFWRHFKYFLPLDFDDDIWFKTLGEAKVFVESKLLEFEEEKLAKMKKRVEKAKSKIISIHYVSHNET